MDKIQLKNYRCFDDTGEIELKPITFLVGANSSGKSSFLKFFPLLKQSIGVKRNGVFLWLSKDVDFKDFKNTVKDGKGDIEIIFTTSNLKMNGGIFFLSSYKKEKLHVSLILSSKPDGSDYLKSLNIDLNGNSINLTFNDGDKVETTINNETITFAEGSYYSFNSKNFFPDILYGKKDKGPTSFFYRSIFTKELYGEYFLEIKNKIQDKDFEILERMISRHYKFINSSKNLEKQINEQLEKRDLNIDFSKLYNYYLHCHIRDIIESINNYMAELIHNSSYIRPLRFITERYYRFQNFDVEEIDSDGENLAMFLLNLNPKDKKSFQEWTKDLFKFEIDTSPKENPYIELQITDDSGNKRNMVDVGFGYSQLLPIIAIIWQSIYKNNNTEKLIVMEQPELHLHPRFQAKFADLLVKVIESCKGNKKDVRFIIETHSEVILNKIGLSIAREKFSKDDVNVLLFNAQNEKMNNYIEVATYSEDGYLTNWPIGFFDDYVD